MRHSVTYHVLSVFHQQLEVQSDLFRTPSLAGRSSLQIVGHYGTFHSQTQSRLDDVDALVDLVIDFLTYVVDACRVEYDELGHLEIRGVDENTCAFRVTGLIIDDLCYPT
jgi:hypothetical protein